ncbi:acyltransferase family protein [Denitrificimonas caeni]|uniref:acyltransferase family protein n=1 Tax=Denitrificimonas caeni TaxID=521720 RepID=UPI0019662265|nr:acyltransferase family protein [Denitrificimonas caeni]
MSVTLFRAEINGLRAIAVISVVLFHFGVSGFSGGFVGVDIFFVISGFLMTSIVIRGVNKNNFNFIDFYLARARRIIPALFFLAVVLLVIGWFYLSPDDYFNLAKEADRSLLFLSNNYFFKKSGYFDPSSHERLLLHTWSLSVEWQFYILYPILLLFISKFSIRLLPRAIFVLFALSFFYSVYKSYADPSYAFYMLPSRAWEMFLGGLVYYAITYERYKLRKEWCGYLGLFSIALSILIYSPATVWPGVAALLPTIGTALIIYSGKDTFITSNFFSQKLGDWSYSIYLWHWPLVVAILLFDIEQTIVVNVILISLSVILGALSYFYIENPTRKYLTSNNRFFVFLLILIPLVAVLGAAKMIRYNKGVIDRLPDEVFAVFNQANNKFDEMKRCQATRDNSDCVYGDGDLDVIVVGDSHAMAIIGSVASTLEESRVLDWTQSGCPTINNIKATGSKPSRCNDFLSPRLNKLSEYSDMPILVANRFSAHFLGPNEKTEIVESPGLYLTQPYHGFSAPYIDEMYSGYVETLCALAENNAVYVLKPIPELKLNIPNMMGRALLVSGEQKRISISLAEYEERNQVALRLLDEVASRCNITLLDPIPYLCDGERCYGDIDGLPIFYDDDHLNMRGSDLLKPLFKKVFLKE